MDSNGLIKVSSILNLTKANQKGRETKKVSCETFLKKVTKFSNNSKIFKESL